MKETEERKRQRNEKDIGEKKIEKRKRQESEKNRGVR